MELTPKSIALIIIGVFVFICVSWIISSQTNHNRMKRKQKRCTSQTTGIVKDMIEVSTRRNGQDIYYTLAKIEYLGGYSIKEMARDREIGDIETVFYNPENPEDAVSEHMMNECLADNAFMGFLHFIEGFIIFVAIGAFMFFVLMGYDMDYLKELISLFMQ